MAEAGPASSRVFISYRRDDSEGHVLALYKLLSERFGEERVFKDTDGIAPGQDFAKVIKRELESCSVLLAVIGKDWATIQDPRTKKRRLDNTNDYLRLEIATALSNEHVLVIPVLVGRGMVPAAEDLPEDLKALATRNAVELSGTRWNADVGLLIRAIDHRVTGSAKRIVEESAPVPAGLTDQSSGGEFEYLETRRQRQIAEHVKSARAAFESKDYEAVLEACNQVFWLQPQEPEARALASKARAALDEEKIQSWLSRASEAIGSEDFVSASDLIDQALALDAAHEVAGRLRRDLLLRRKKKERERERDDQHRAALERAQRSLDQDHFEEAIHHADTALALVPDSAQALAVRARAEAAQEDERRERELKRKAQQAVKDARSKFAKGHHGAAIGILEQFSPPHDLVALALKELQHELAEMAARQRREAEERQRAEAAALLERQRLQAEQDARARETVEQAQQLAFENQWDSALELLASFSPPHDLVTDARVELETERQRQAAERQRELEARHEEEMRRQAIELERQAELDREQQELDRAERDQPEETQQAQLEPQPDAEPQREYELEGQPPVEREEAVEELRRLEAEWAAAAIAEAIAEETRHEAAPRARLDTPTLEDRAESDQEEGDRQHQPIAEIPSEQPARAQAAPQDQAFNPLGAKVAPASKRAFPWTVPLAAAAGILVVVAGGVRWVSGRSTPNELPPVPIVRFQSPMPEAPAPGAPTYAPPATPPSAPSDPVESSTRTARVDEPKVVPQNPAAPQPINQPRQTPAQAKRLAELRQAARAQRQAGRSSEALDAVLEGLKIDPSDSALTGTLNLLLRDSQSASERAKQEATKAGAATLLAAEFSQSLQHDAEAAKLRDAKQTADAVRRYWLAADDFGKLTTSARELAAAAAAEQAAKQKQLEEEQARLKAAEEKARANAQAPLTAGGEKADPVVRPKPAGPTEEQRILDVMEQYRAAYERLEAAGVIRLHPALSQSQLSSVFAQYRSYAMTIANPKITVTGTTATVACTVSMSIRPRVGDIQSTNRETMFRLQKVGDQWTIVDRR